jgi:hypothetical protein
VGQPQRQKKRQAFSIQALVFPSFCAIWKRDDGTPEQKRNTSESDRLQPLLAQLRDGHASFCVELHAMALPLHSRGQSEGGLESLTCLLATVPLGWGETEVGRTGRLYCGPGYFYGSIRQDVECATNCKCNQG